MTKEEFRQWAQAMCESYEEREQGNEAFAKELEQADKGAAAHVRKVNSAVTDLVRYLASTLSKQG